MCVALVYGLVCAASFLSQESSLAVRLELRVGVEEKTNTHDYYLCITDPNNAHAFFLQCVCVMCMHITCRQTDRACVCGCVRRSEKKAWALFGSVMAPE